MPTWSSGLLRVVLALSGAFILFTALNVALGGILTMGWQGETNFVRVTDEAAFLIHDSHTRFIAGVWAGCALVFFAASTAPHRYLPFLRVVMGLIFLGGLARLTQGHLNVLLSADIAGSLAAELVGMPLLWAWTSHMHSRENAPQPS